MKKNLQKIPLILSTTLFIFGCFVFVFLLKQTNDNNQKAKDGASAWQEEVSRREEITSLNYSLDQNTNDITLLENHFANGSDVVPFLDTIENLAPLSGTKVKISSVDAGAIKSGLVIGLKVSGSFENVYKFLTLLENSPYELNFLSVDIHTLPAASDTSLKNIKSSNWEGLFKIQLLSFIP